ncbi:MAG: sigma-70 family RNA polymerase sigma factor [Fimbriimonadaceae bacterium]
MDAKAGNSTDGAPVTRIAAPTSNAVVVSAVVDRAKAAGFDEDVVLVERYLQGDASAFEVLYSRYYDKVFAIARGILLDADEAADAVQEIFTLVYRHIGRFDRRSRFSTWLFRIAVNRSIQQSRRNKNRSKLVSLNEAMSAETPVETNIADPAVYEALAKLQPSDRALLVLFYWDELSLQEIGESLGCGVNAAKTRLYRARERFRGVYEEAGE